MEQNQHATVAKKKSGKQLFASVRVSIQTKKRIQDLLSRANKKKYGKKIHPDELLSLALDQLSDDNLQKIQENSLSNADRLELSYIEYSKKYPSVSKDEFLGQLLTKNVTNPSDKVA